MAKIGDVCPLFFSPIKDKFGIEGDYIQTFYTSDPLLIQLFGESVPEFVLNNLSEETSEDKSSDLLSHVHNESVTMYHITLSGLPDGIYSVTVDGQTSEPFCVTSDTSILDNTTLIRYSHKDNNSVYDNLFWLGEEQQIFSWRVEAGFKSSGYAPHVDNEPYRNQYQETIHLYSMPYDSHTLTLGSAQGVPYWFVRHLNRIFCLSSVEIDGRFWVRSESSVPEITPVMEESPLFTATLILEPVENAVSGAGGISESGSGASVVGFSITNPTDGQMLQYSEDESAFVNVTTVGV